MTVQRGAEFANNGNTHGLVNQPLLSMQASLATWRKQRRANGIQKP